MEARCQGWTAGAWIVVSVAFVAFAGCGESVRPVPDGHLTFTWEVSPQGCEDAGVETVATKLRTGERVIPRSFACCEGRATFENLEPAKYSLELKGLDAAGQARYSARREAITVRGGETTRGPHLRLTSMPGDLTAEWRFENGRLCDTNGVDRVRVSVYDADEYEIGDKRVACDAAGTTLEGLPPGDVLVEARARGEETLYAGFATGRIPRGEGTEVAVTLSRADPPSRAEGE